MGDTNLTGPVYNQREGSVTVRQTFPTGVITDVAVKFCRIKASTFAPVIIEAQVLVTTIDATEDISVGYTAATYTDLINAASLGTAAAGGTFLPAANAVGKKYLTDDTDLYFIGSTGADTGVATIILDLTTINTDSAYGL